MKAFVLAGGQGTRLRSRFGDLPKPLAPLQGKPFLVWQLEWLRDRGIEDVVVCAGYGADQVERELSSRPVEGIRLAFSVETEPLGTAGALRHAGAHVDGPVLVVNGDTLLTADPWRLERARWESGALGAIALYSVEDATSRGRVEAEADGRVVRFHEKDPASSGSAWVNGGLYAFSEVLWRQLPAGASSLEHDVLPALAAQGLLHGLPCEGEFFDIGTPEEWERAERRFAR